MMETELNLNKKERNSGVELLKLFAVVLIVLSHSMPTTASASGEHTMNLSLATTSLQRFAIVLLQYGGQIGNGIFIISSAWFLVGSGKVRPKKMVYIIADTVVVSVLFLAAFLLCGYRLGMKEILWQFFPITAGANWFIICYLMFYAVHPVLNMAVEALGRRRLLMLDVVLAVMYCGVNLVKRGAYYYNNFIGFVCIYFFVAYVKKYLLWQATSVKFNRLVLMLSAAGLLCSVALTNILGLRLEWFSDKVTKWNLFMNPFVLLMGLSALNLARRHRFVSKGVNYLSGCSMVIYIVHGNRLVMDHLKQDYFRYVYHTYTYHYELLWVLLAAGVLLVGGTVLSVLYSQTIQKMVRRGCDYLCAAASQLLSAKDSTEA